MGYPGAVLRGRPAAEPKNLSDGWVGFDFEKAFGCPVKMINGAAMQALGSYEGDRMLFLELGTGLGSALITDGVLVPMELAHLLYRKGRTYEDYVGLRGLTRYDKKELAPIRRRCRNGAPRCAASRLRGAGRRQCHEAQAFA